MCETEAGLLQSCSLCRARTTGFVSGGSGGLWYGADTIAVEYNLVPYIITLMSKKIRTWWWLYWFPCFSNTLRYVFGTCFPKKSSKPQFPHAYFSKSVTFKALNKHRDTDLTHFELWLRDLSTHPHVKQYYTTGYDFHSVLLVHVILYLVFIVIKQLDVWP